MRGSIEGWNGGDGDGWLQSSHPEVEWFSEIARQVEGVDTVYRGPAESATPAVCPA